MQLRVEKGAPTAEEIAALVGVVYSLSTSEQPRPRVSAWWRSGLPVARPGWGESGLPRMSHD